jgi:plasmid stabilization system protein ParE
MRTVVLSKQASNKLEKLLNYLETEWSENVKQNFIKKFDNSVKFISSFPEATEKSNLKKGLHRCVVTEQTTIYYQFNNFEIQIVTIFDTRMNPKRLQCELQRSRN